MDSSWNNSTAKQNAILISPWVILSYAALGHAMDRMLIWQNMCNGARIGFCSGTDLESLLGDMRILKPTLFVAMPGNSLLDREILNFFWLYLIDYWTSLFGRYNHALTSVLAKVPKSSSPAVIESLEERALTDIRNDMGGRIMIVGTGGAKISNAVMDWMGKALQCGVINACNEQPRSL